MNLPHRCDPVASAYTVCNVNVTDVVNTTILGTTVCNVTDVVNTTIPGTAVLEQLNTTIPMIPGTAVLDELGVILPLYINVIVLYTFALSFRILAYLALRFLHRKR